MDPIIKNNIIDVDAQISASQTQPKVERNYPTELIDLPSKGLLYPVDHPLHSGVVEMRYMTTKDEDILTTQSYIKKGVVIDELLKSLIVTQFDYNTLLIGDKNALMVAAARLGYGPMYETRIVSEDGNEEPVVINLETDVKFVEFDETIIIPGTNLFKFETSIGDVIEFALLTVGGANELDKALKQLNITKGRDNQISTRLRYLIKSVNGSSELKTIKEFVDNMLARDSKLFREYVAAIQPDIDLNYEMEDSVNGEPFRGKIQIGIDLFYPNLRKGVKGRIS